MIAVYNQKQEVIFEMAKCIRCGRSTLLHGHVKLKDAAICTPCYKALGFEVKLGSTDLLLSSSYSWDEIKDGKDEYNRRYWAKRNAEFAQSESERLGLYYVDYQTLYDLDCIDNEMKTVERACALLEDEGCRTKKISYEREPGEPLNAFLGDELLYQLKYTKDVKWIRIGPDGDKIRISGPAGINKTVGKLVDRYNEIK